MESMKDKKKYRSPSWDILLLSASDVLKESFNIPDKDDDENQGVWIG